MIGVREPTMTDRTPDPVPRDPEPFTEAVARILKDFRPDASVQVAAPFRLAVDGRTMQLENLHRMIDDASDATAVIRGYLERVLEGDSIGSTPVPLAVARGRIMPRIQPETIFETVDREQVAHVPWVNGTVIVFVIDMPEVTVSVSTEQMIRWGLQADDLESIARRNLMRYRPRMEMQMISAKDGGRAAFVSLRDGYDAARILIEGLHGRLASELGSNFLVATPARDVFLAISQGPDTFVERVRERVERDFKRMPYPITTDFFIVTRDGVAGTALAA
jgi:uncharacterized protein YtpQ (UPF0354 family)